MQNTQIKNITERETGKDGMMMLKAVLVDQNYGSATAEDLALVCHAYQQAGIELELQHFTTEDEIIEGCQDAIAILGTGNPPITRRVMEALPNLKYIQRFGIGVNSIDLDSATQLGKLVLNLPGFCIQELADLATAMILGLVRNVGYYDRSIRSGGWPKGKYLLPGNVREMTLGLHGFGGAARCLYDIFHKGFGTKVIACDPYVPEEQRKLYDVEFVDFDEMVRRSDILSLHTPLTDETKHIFNKETFRKMKNNAMIINTARGPLINQDDLAWALEQGEIRYAGLDTVEQEPIAPDSPLLQMENVILNPHSGFYGESSKRTQIRMVCELVPGAVVTGKLPAHCVANRAVLKTDVGLTLV